MEIEEEEKMMIIVVKSEKERSSYNGCTAPLRIKSRERKAMLFLVNRECNKLDLLSLSLYQALP